MAASNINENKEQLLKEKDILASLKKPQDVDFNIIKKKYKNLSDKYRKLVPPLPNQPFDPQSYLDTLTKEVLTRLTDLHANDNDVELIKNTTFKTLQDDPLYSEWKVNSERDIKNKKHPSNQMIEICSQSTDPQKQRIVVLNSMNYLGQDPSHYLNSELYDTTFDNFFK